MGTTERFQEPSSRVTVGACFFGLFVASFLIKKVGALSGNHAVQVPLVLWLNDRALYPQDPFMADLTRYPSILWPLVALLARAFPLEGTLRVLFVLERLFGLYAAGRLARALAPRSRLAVVGATALFAFTLESVLGYGTIVGAYLEHTALAISFFLLAAAAFYERRPVAWAIWLAAGFNLTSLYGAFALSYFGASLLFDPEYRDAWKPWGRSFLLFLALASYEVYLSLAATRIPSTDEASWLVAVWVRGWSHLLPLTWPSTSFVQFALFLVLFGFFLAHVRRESAPMFRHGVLWSAVGVCWLVEAFVAPYVLESRPLMMMQPARATDLLVCFSGVAMIAIAARRLEQGHASGRHRTWVLALAASFLVWNLPGAWIVAVAIAIAALPPVWRRVGAWVSPRAIAWLLVAWVVLAGLGAERVRWSESHDPWNLIFRGPRASTRSLAAWAEQNTPRDSVFLLNASADDDLDQFMGLAKRSIFTSAEQGTALFWAPDFVPEWLGRLRALGLQLDDKTEEPIEDEFDRAFRDLDDDHVLRLKGRYRLNYWVVPHAHPSRFRVAWTGEHYKVLEISSSSRSFFAERAMD